MTIIGPALLTDEQADQLAASVEMLTPDAQAVTPEAVKHWTGVLIDILRDHVDPDAAIPTPWWAQTAATGGLRVGYSNPDRTQVWVAPSGVTLQL